MYKFAQEERQRGLAEDLIGFGGVGTAVGAVIGASTGAKQREAARLQALQAADARFDADIALQRANVELSDLELARLQAPVTRRERGIVFDLANATPEQQEAMSKHFDEIAKLRDLKMNSIFQPSIEAMKAESRVINRRMGFGALGGLAGGLGAGFGYYALRNSQPMEQQAEAEFYELMKHAADTEAEDHRLQQALIGSGVGLGGGALTGATYSAVDRLIDKHQSQKILNAMSEEERAKHVFYPKYDWSIPSERSAFKRNLAVGGLAGLAAGATVPFLIS